MMSTYNHMMDSDFEIDEYVMHIRDKALKDVLDHRSLKRSALFNSKRVHLGQIELLTKIASIEDFGKTCLLYVCNKKVQQLRLIRFNLLGGQKYISKFLNTEGALYTLIGGLTGGNTELQLEALFTFVNLGFGAQDECLRVCKRVGIYFISIGKNNPPLLELCLWAFGNLCGGNPKVCRVAYKQGIEELLATSLSSHHENVVGSALYCLKLYLATVPDRVKSVCTAERVKLLTGFLSKTSEGFTDLCWILFIISSTKRLCPLLVNSGAASLSLEFLNNHCQSQEFEVSIVTALVRLLTNIVAVVTNVALEICLRSEMFASICNCSLRSSYPHLHAETIQLIANVINAVRDIPEGEKIIEESNLKPRLESILSQNLVPEFVQNVGDINFVN